VDTQHPRLLRVMEVAERLQISRSKAYELIESGAMPHYRIGGSVRVAEEQLQAYLESVRREPEPPRTATVARPRTKLKHLTL
jgi:excisionase family DNA binding protein